MNKPLDFIKAKLGDEILLEEIQQTPYDLILTVYDEQDEIILDDILPEYYLDDKLFFKLLLSSQNFEPLKYYKLLIQDNTKVSEDKKHFYLYVTDEKNFEDRLDRCLGLSGHNCRKFDYVWVSGQLKSFHIKLYASATLLELANNGTSDSFLAHYLVEISYNKNYTINKMTCVKL